MAKEDRYENCEFCEYKGHNPANEKVFLIRESDSEKGYRISLITSESKKIFIETRLNSRGKLESYFEDLHIK